MFGIITYHSLSSREVNDGARDYARHKITFVTLLYRRQLTMMYYAWTQVDCRPTRIKRT